jgi:hypothetical protein
MLKKMCIEESGDGYKLDSNMSAEYMNTFDSRINNLNNAKNDLKKLIDSMLTPSQVNAANNAFNLAANIFPGGASWKDIKNGDFWKKNKCYQYFKMKRREVIASFKAQNSAYASVGSDAILGGMSIDDEKGFIEITMNGEDGFETYRYDEQNPLPGMELVHEDTPIEYTIKQTNDKNQTTLALVNEKDEIISSMYGAIDIAVNGNEELKEKVMKIGGLKGYTNESELMTSGV